ncbi:MAG TPA: alanine--tRNA ligase [Firmicutes bacterium]|nr:alanine--tRNA ligase [Bacillota bacterium]
MQKLGLNEIREKYLSFFESKGHLRLPSFPLVPQSDASLLLINAGMAPLKPYFTGKETPPSKRVTTCQKCIRTADIENVGHTARHGTFFEMLGNFSFGDYFKSEATSWAWEFVTKVLEIPTDRLWVSVYEGDEEAVEIWTKKVGVDRDRIVYMGKEDNFWEIGTGPCGPCSEIYYDRGEEYGCGKPDCKVGCDCDRYVEFWNLVFTQFDKDEDGNYNKLAHPNIDTGMGLERIACIMQGVTSIFEVDTIRKVLDSAAETAGVKYGDSEKNDVSLRVITDHIRSTVFLVSDGVLPSNEGRGYVLRRLLRRAARHGKLLGIDGTFLYKLAKVVAEESKSAYPELEDKFEYIEKVIKTEEERFAETIDQGIEILKQYIDELKQAGKTELDGDKAFKLYDTYGFPIDLTKEILEEQGMTVAEKTFEDLMTEQRERARQARGDMEGAAWEDDIFKSIEGNTVFDGYTKYEEEAEVLGISVGGERVEKASEGDEVTLVLDRTTFYAESGGQVADTGVIEGEDCKIAVTDVKKQNGKFLHKGKVLSGAVSVGDKVTTKIDAAKREAIRRNHTAVHLIQAALRKVLGNHVVQSGSYVDEKRFRFDFSHFAPMTKEELTEVGKLVNQKIFEAIDVETMEMDQKAARDMGAMALFSEKYGDVVRVVKIDDYSIELCGGCHAANTGALGLMQITSEAGVAAGVRRIEGVTGAEILNLINEKDETINKTAEILRTNPSSLVSRAESVSEELKEQKHEIERLKSKLAQGATAGIADGAEEVDGIKVIAKLLDDGMDMNTMREVGDKVKESVSNALIVLASKAGGKVNLVSMATKDAVKSGAHAGRIISEVAKQLGGGGGGKPDSAQAGGKNPEKVNEALSGVKDILIRLKSESKK